jgi:predicted HAD superfamily Cof-like phosphohydrolase
MSISVFADQAKFMAACGQTIDQRNEEQFQLYLRLIREEAGELMDAVATNNRPEIFDALLDLIVVTFGAGRSSGFPMAAGWEEVIRSNMAKIDPETGMVRKRSDGKILKPAGWKPPKLDEVLKDWDRIMRP